MLHPPLLIPPSSDFWQQAATILLEHPALSAHRCNARDLSSIRVLVPGFAHARLLKEALADAAGSPVIPPRMATLSSWLDMLPPEPAQTSTSESERIMGLYAELRQHGWLKTLFAARRNIDLLPLAQTLIGLFDELSAVLLPAMQTEPGAAEERWEAALARLPLAVRHHLSDEANLVWTIWKSQLNNSDAVSARFARMLRLASAADAPLLWIYPEAPDRLHEAFLHAYAKRQVVLPVTLDWRARAVPPALAMAWKEMLEDEPGDCPSGTLTLPSRLSLHAASGLEDEAQHGAQTVIDWLQGGRRRIAIVAQDREVARRIRALLERAQVMVDDETGWRLSTTRNAAGVAALLDTVSTRAGTKALLDLLKTPCLFPELPDKVDLVMTVERALRQRNVLGGWETVLRVVNEHPEAQAMLARVAAEANKLSGRKTLAQWGTVTSQALEALGMRVAMESDPAGSQILALLDTMIEDCAGMGQLFSFAEWRAWLSLHLESTTFVPEVSDRRVVMLQLSGAPMRRFDAVLVVGADAEHLPAPMNETLFFASAVRRELGLATRECMQRRQLRDLAELLSANPELVLTYQAQRRGDPNPVSTWVARLQLTLQQNGIESAAAHSAPVPVTMLTPMPSLMPTPRASALLPSRLSASAYNCLVACPYQFFATRMLGLDTMEELTELPEKRHYGEWLHAILLAYHETVRDHRIPEDEREAVLRSISESVFNAVLADSAAALGYYARWQKAIPAYLAWANERERQGWYFASGEQQLEKILIWEDGQITLYGYIDRMDEHQDGKRAVLDYKTRNLSSLRERLKESEDHQLAFYGLLSDMPVTAASYVALEISSDRIGEAPAVNYPEWQALLEARIVDTVRAVRRGAALPATGVERVCAYCTVRGLCRKGMW